MPQTLTDKEYQRLRDAAVAIIREMGVECGGSNVQMGINPVDGTLAISHIPELCRFLPLIIRKRRSSSACAQVYVFKRRALAAYCGARVSLISVSLLRLSALQYDLLLTCPRVCQAR